MYFFVSLNYSVTLLPPLPQWSVTWKTRTSGSVEMHILKQSFSSGTWTQPDLPPVELSSPQTQNTSVLLFGHMNEVLQFVFHIIILWYKQQENQMMEVMDLIKCFYSTFIHYFLIKLVDKYFYMFISEYTFTA